MSDDRGAIAHLSLRAPIAVVEQFDRVAAVLQRDRSWVVLRALRQYLDREGREVLEDAEAIAALAHGEGLPFEDALRDVDGIIDGPEPKARRKAAR
jgi:predicted transcriptional regulator